MLKKDSRTFLKVGNSFSFPSFSFFQPIPDRHLWIQCQLDVTMKFFLRFLYHNKTSRWSDTKPLCFFPPSKLPKYTPHRRGASVGLATVATVGPLGGGIVVGGFDECGSRGLFGNCQYQSKANAENVRRLVEFQNSFTNYVTEFITNTEKKFFLIMNRRSLTQFNMKWPRLRIRAESSFRSNWLVMKEIFIFYATAINCYSPTSNLTLLLMLFLLYFQEFVLACKVTSSFCSLSAWKSWILFQMCLKDVC